jgi:hypothetical protein
MKDRVLCLSDMLLEAGESPKGLRNAYQKSALAGLVARVLVFFKKGHLL